MVATFLKNHTAVEKMYYPGFKDFPQYELAKHPMKLPGAMIAFEVAGGLEGGISEGLVRLSAGLEDPEDIMADLRQVLDTLV